MNGFYAVCAKSSGLGCEVVIRFWRESWRIGVNLAIDSIDSYKIRAESNRFWRGFRCRFNGRESKKLKGNGNEKSLFMLY